MGGTLFLLKPRIFDSVFQGGRGRALLILIQSVGRPKIFPSGSRSTRRSQLERALRISPARGVELGIRAIVQQGDHSACTPMLRRGGPQGRDDWQIRQMEDGEGSSSKIENQQSSTVNLSRLRPSSSLFVLRLQVLKKHIPPKPAEPERSQAAICIALFKESTEYSSR